MPHILITGGAGFLGSHLCDALLGEGHEVVCVDNFLSGSRDNLKHLAGNPKFRLIEHDVTVPLPQAASLRLDAIFHLASPASPNPDSPVGYLAHPVETLLVNSLGTKHMLDLADRHDCQVVLASTSEVYGDPAVHPQPESYWGHVSPNGLRSCYDEGKRFLEAISFAYHRTKGVKIKVVRIFNTYGPRMVLTEGRLIPELINAALHHTPFRQFGDGTNSRSFCYVDDLIKGLMRVYAVPESVGQVINLGNPDEYSVQAAIKLVEEVAGVKLAIELAPALADDPRRRRPDISKARDLLNWQPTTPLREGLKLMLEFYGRQD